MFLKIKHFTALLSGLILLGLGSTTQVWASNVTGNFKPSVSVSNVCVINSTDNLIFGAYIPNSPAPLQTSGQIKLSCTKGAVASVIPASGGSALSGGGTTLKYALYADSAYSKTWGTGTPTYVNYNLGTSQVHFTTSTQSLSFSACQTLANGLSFAYINQGVFPTSRCYTGFDPTGAAVYYTDPPLSAGTTNGLYYTNGAVIKSMGASSAFYVAIPTGSPLVSGTTYSILTSTNGGSQAISGTSTSVKNPIALTYYAQLPAKQDVPPGTYIDTVTLQVSF